MERLLVGNTVCLGVSIRQKNVPVDVETATAIVQLPSGERIESVAAHTGLGEYLYKYKLRDDGLHTLRIETTNPDTAQEEQVYALPSVLVP